MSRRGLSPIDRLAGVGLTRPDPVSGEAWCLLPDGHLHSDVDAICPRCLTWIDGREFVRLTAYGLLQHEVCPRDLGRPDQAADDLRGQRDQR